MDTRDFGYSFEKDELSDEEMDRLIDAAPTQAVKGSSTKRKAKPPKPRESSNEYWSAERAGMYCKISEKRVYTARQADEAIAEAARDLSTPPLSKYKCNDCSGWHLTSRPGFGDRQT